MKSSVRFLLLVIALLFSVQLWAQQKLSYKTDSIQFVGTATGLTYGGDITLPVIEGKKLPAVIIMSGTGSQDRDGKMAGHRIFAEIADYLGQNGIIVLRMDDRGVGQTSGNYDEATTGDFANDALAAVNYLKSRPEVDAAKIGLVGHSEGGASISIAASKSKNVAYLVSIAGLCMSGYDAQIKQNQDIVSQAKLPDYDKKRSNEVNKLMFQTALKYANSPDMEEMLTQAYTSWKKQDSIYFNSLNIKFDHFRFPAHRWIPMAAGKWYRYFIQYDPAKTLKKVDIPILAFNGDKDLMVSCEENLRNWATFPKAAKHNRVKIVRLKNVNHLLLPCESCVPTEYSKITKGVSREMLVTMADWINSLKNN
ncbi:alpha/beta hydrolase family protein [Pedobacter frigidisoli]|uniref:alpha/beta hydrolase family protein n=1 Tax=Pedobacter frigidisoli TaxID=2530455 RepID=UPI00292E808A|nr:alpha/beta fold hydrolase [Pedobacter frigidisoli]